MLPALLANPAVWQAAAGIGSSILGGVLGKPSKMEQGYDVVQMPQYSWTEGNRGLLADYAAGGLQSIQEGNPPSWWQNMQPKLQEGMSRQNALTYYGNKGTRTGIINDAMSMGSMAGLKGKRAMTPGMQAMQDYGNREAQINDYLNQLGVNVTQNSERNYINTIMGMPGGPETQIVNKMGGVSGGNSWGQGLGQIGGSLLGNMDWGNLFNKPSTAGTVGGLQDFNQFGASTNSLPYNQPNFNPAQYAGNNQSMMPASWPGRTPIVASQRPVSIWNNADLANQASQMNWLGF